MKPPEMKSTSIVFVPLWTGIQEDGTICCHVFLEDYNLDKVNNGRVLYFLCYQTKEKYKIALSHIREQLETHPRTDCGSFWHKQIYPYQIWLDGLYMGQPLYLEYEKRFNGGEHTMILQDSF